MRYALILVLLCLVLLPVQAQDDWQIVLYVEDTEASNYTAELQIFTLNGLQERIPLPQDLGAPNAEYTFGALVSDDLRFVALYQSLPYGTGDASLRIYNRELDECCYDISASIEGVLAFSFAGFAPDASGFAFSYIKNTFPQAGSGGIMIVDAATGIISQDIPMFVIGEHIPVDDFETWALMGDWTAEGIHFVPFCYACDAPFDEAYSLYQPQTGEFTANSGVYPGDHLESTGEWLHIEHDRRYSYDMFEGLFPVSNVVQYSTSDLPNSVADPVIFASDDIINIRDVTWVADGNAILVESHPDTGLWEIVWRDGRRSQMAASGLSHLGGTPTGWLANSENDGSDILLHFDAQSLQAQELTRIEDGSIYRIVQRPQLGQNLSATPFVAVPPPDRPVAHCPNFLPSRLVVGDRARVTPGSANRLRARPVNGDVVGQIPGGAEFTVLGEAFCDEYEGILWWQVDYQGLVGWTAEGQGSDYWVEPVNASP